ncbi:MAG: sigma-70 family RNA polymerase sigma factor [SAR324 cluster bacterium]|nr:sigma-70 family RNA polymerase sigma factor [SAR324 cluster bacterium]
MTLQNTESSKEAIQNVELWTKEYGNILFRYALTRVCDENLAADIVQNTLLAALTAKDSFQGKSTIKTWLMGILKHKIMDHYRQKQKENFMSDAEMENIGPEDFNSAGMWHEKPHEWSFSPEQILENKEAQLLLWECIDSLPERMRLLFILREIDGESTETICDRMNLSVSNFSVLLYRARHKLRKDFVSRGVKVLGML